MVTQFRPGEIFVSLVVIFGVISGLWKAGWDYLKEDHSTPDQHYAELTGTYINIDNGDTVVIGEKDVTINAQGKKVTEKYSLSQTYPDTYNIDANAFGDEVRLNNYDYNVSFTSKNDALKGEYWKVPDTDFLIRQGGFFNFNKDRGWYSGSEYGNGMAIKLTEEEGVLYMKTRFKIEAKGKHRTFYDVSSYPTEVVTYKDGLLTTESGQKAYVYFSYKGELVMKYKEADGKLISTRIFKPIKNFDSYEHPVPPGYAIEKRSHL